MIHSLRAWLAAPSSEPASSNSAASSAHVSAWALRPTAASGFGLEQKDLRAMVRIVRRIDGIRGLDRGTDKRFESSASALTLDLGDEPIERR